MTPELRAALRLVVEAHPVGGSVVLPREFALELLAGPQQPEDDSGPTDALPPADLDVPTWPPA